MTGGRLGQLGAGAKCWESDVCLRLWGPGRRQAGPGGEGPWAGPKLRSPGRAALPGISKSRAGPPCASLRLCFRPCLPVSHLPRPPHLGRVLG